MKTGENHDTDGAYAAPPAKGMPPKNPENFAPVHSYLLAEQGVSMIEALWLEELATDQVYEFLFITSPLKMSGATASPVRPLAIPVRPNN